MDGCGADSGGGYGVEEGAACLLCYGFRGARGCYRKMMIIFIFLVSVTMMMLMIILNNFHKSHFLIKCILAALEPHAPFLPYERWDGE